MRSVARVCVAWTHAEKHGNESPYRARGLRARDWCPRHSLIRSGRRPERSASTREAVEQTPLPQPAATLRRRCCVKALAARMRGRRAWAARARIDSRVPERGLRARDFNPRQSRIHAHGCGRNRCPSRSPDNMRSWKRRSRTKAEPERRSTCAHLRRRSPIGPAADTSRRALFPWLPCIALGSPTPQPTSAYSFPAWSAATEGSLGRLDAARRPLAELNDGPARWVGPLRTDPRASRGVLPTRSASDM